MPGFRRKQYSTAERIIESVTERLSLGASKNPLLRGAKTREYDGYLAELKNSHTLSTALGNVLKNSLEERYAVYQALAEPEKKALRQIICDAYVMEVEQSMAEFKVNIRLTDKVVGWKLRDCLCAELTLPDAPYTKEDELTALLQEPLKVVNGFLTDYAAAQKAKEEDISDLFDDEEPSAGQETGTEMHEMKH